MTISITASLCPVDPPVGQTSIDSKLSIQRIVRALESVDLPGWHLIIDGKATWSTRQASPNQNRELDLS
jgi:hypothetical protein